MGDDELHQVYTEWNTGELEGYLMEITGNIFRKVDEKTGKRLIDEILDIARQKGTGMWTSQSAMELQVPIPTIDMAVAMRDLSVFEGQRREAAARLQWRTKQFAGDKKSFTEDLRRAMYPAVVITYAQGMALLDVASERYAFGLDLEAVARIWRGGCIIRAALLEDIRKAYRGQPKLPNLMLDSEMAKKVMAGQQELRRVICSAADLGLPVPGLMTALGYLDGYRSSWLPANLIQAQRDYFGSHTYERIDAKGTFHTDWVKS
jgi:6-phosphogluconate dehydrogenase